MSKITFWKKDYELTEEQEAVLYELLDYFQKVNERNSDEPKNME